jgi:hypothetical protein
MSKNKTFLYLARSIKPAGYRPEYLEKVKFLIPEAEDVAADSYHWFVTVFKKFNYNEFAYIITVRDMRDPSKEVTENLLFTDPEDVQRHIELPFNMFLPTERSIFVYVGDASVEEVYQITNQWIQTQS